MSAKRIPMDESQFRVHVEERTKSLWSMLHARERWEIVPDASGVKRLVAHMQDGPRRGHRYCGLCGCVQGAYHLGGQGSPCLIRAMGEDIVRATFPEDT